MREELAKQAWIGLVQGMSPEAAASMAFEYADVFIARAKTERIADGISRCVTLENLASYWASIEVQDVLRQLRKGDPDSYARLEKAKDARKAQIADNHQIEHAKEQAA